MPDFQNFTLNSRKSSKHRTKLEDWDRAASLENLFQTRPSLAAAMLGSWDGNSTHHMEAASSGNNNSQQFDKNSQSQKSGNLHLKNSPMMNGRFETSTNISLKSSKRSNSLSYVNKISPPLGVTGVPKNEVVRRKATVKRRLSRAKCSTNLLRSKSETAMNKISLNQSMNSPDASDVFDLPGKNKSRVLLNLRRTFGSKPQDLNVEEVFSPHLNNNNNNFIFEQKKSSLVSKLKQRIVMSLTQNTRESKRLANVHLNSTNKKIRRAQSVTTLHHININNDCIQLNQLLRSKDFTRSFRKFLRREYSEENLDFWLRCEEYKHEKCSKRFKKAGEIYDKFLRPGSFNEINVCAETRQEVEKKLVRPDDKIFIKAQTQIYHLMLTDSYPRFMEAKWSQKFLSV